jgi:uncharacterized membrane-anchored protein YjiN (DUF445 family)
MENLGEGFFDECSINDVISKLIDFDPSIKFKCETLSDGGLRIVYGIERMETDEEYNRRVEHMKSYLARREESDRKLYEQLKAKFEKGESND